MPRLGIDDDDDNNFNDADEGRSLMPRHTTVAYAAGSGSSTHPHVILAKIVMVATVVLIAHNAFTNDYRNDAKEYLKQAGTPDDKIAALLGQTRAERQREVEAKQEHAEALQDKVVRLEGQVDRLLWKVFGTNETQAPTV